MVSDLGCSVFSYQPGKTSEYSTFEEGNVSPVASTMSVACHLRNMQVIIVLSVVTDSQVRVSSCLTEVGYFFRVRRKISSAPSIGWVQTKSRSRVVYTMLSTRQTIFSATRKKCVIWQNFQELGLPLASVNGNKSMKYSYEGVSPIFVLGVTGSLGSQ